MLLWICRSWIKCIFVYKKCWEFITWVLSCMRLHSSSVQWDTAVFAWFSHFLQCMLRCHRPVWSVLTQLVVLSTMCFIKAVITSTEASGSAAACIQSKLRFNRFLAAATVLLLSDRYNHTLLMNVSLFPLNVTVFYLPLVIPTSPRPPPPSPSSGASSGFASFTKETCTWKNQRCPYDIQRRHVSVPTGPCQHAVPAAGCLHTIR